MVVVSILWQKQASFNMSSSLASYIAILLMRYSVLPGTSGTHMGRYIGTVHTLGVVGQVSVYGGWCGAPLRSSLWRRNLPVSECGRLGATGCSKRSTLAEGSAIQGR